MVSLVPIFNAGFIGGFLISLILWQILPLFIFIFILSWSLVNVAGYTGSNLNYYGCAFWLFILSEVCVFGTLFVCCLSHEATGEMVRISEFLEAPFVGCFLLLGSSVTATTFHHSLGLSSSGRWLLLTIILGTGFVLLQFYEFRLTSSGWSDSFYSSCCFAVVGLHFSHVTLGLAGLSFFWTLLESLEGTLQLYYANLVVWYWHFVDYVWLFVYMIVYLL